MAITYTEELKNIKVKQIDGLTDVIVEVEWVLTATHSDGRVIENTQVVFLDPPDSTTFSEYSSLTKEEVREWIRKYVTDESVNNRKEGIEAVFEQNLQFEEPKPKETPWGND